MGPPSQNPPAIQQAACTRNDSSLKTIISELRDQNAILMKTIETLSANKENIPKSKSNTRHIWHYCYSCGANTSHPSTKCFSNYKYVNHKNEAIFKDMMGGSKRNLRVPAARKILNQA